MLTKPEKGQLKRGEELGGGSGGREGETPSPLNRSSTECN